VTASALRAVFQLTSALAHAGSEQELFDRALDTVMQALRPDRAAILLLDAHDRMCFRISRGLSASYQRAVEGHSPWSRATLDPDVLQVSDVTLDASLAALHEALAAEGIRALTFIPLTSGGRLVGKLMLYHDVPRALGEAEVELGCAIAGHVAFMIQRAEADRALRQSEQHLREAQSIAQMGSFFWDAASEEVTWSVELYRLYGREPGAFAPSFESYLACIHEDDRSRVLEALQGAMSLLTPFSHEYRALHPSGELRWVHARGRPVLGPGGEVIGLSGTCHDITERKQREAAVREGEVLFQQLVENIHEAFWMTDGAMRRLLYVSSTVERIWGAPRAHILATPHFWLDSIHPDDRAQVHSALKRKRADGRFDVEYRIVRPDGGVRRVHARAFPLHDGEGKLDRVAGVAEDITDRHHLEARTRQAQKLEALGTLAGGIAHDFNNILGAIVGNAGLARLDLAPHHPAEASLREIDQACERARGLIQQILAFARPRPPERRVTRLHDVVEEAVRLMRATLPAGVELVVTLAPDAPAVMLDPTQAHQALVNLCTNAWHALGKRGGRIEIALRPAQIDGGALGAATGLPPGSYACLSVRDSGHGMSAATIERIFEPFFTTKAAGEGTGLGLSVVHGIVKAHEGAIQVVSEPGQGTTFHLYFPSAPEEKPMSTEKAPAASPQGQGQRVLYVDDEAALVRFATRVLDRLGYATTGQSDPEEALRLLESDPARFDLIITDLNMPLCSGLQLAERVRALPSKVPIVLISGYLTEEAEREISRLSISQVLQKPVTSQALGECVRDLLAEAGK
jgi:PAS domain S-box-containing protein